MRKSSKIVQISGIKGMLFVAFFTACLFAGFVVFPGMVAMYLWNLAASALSFNEINIFQGTLLWGIFALSFYLAGGSRSVIELKRPSKLTDAEVDDLLAQIKKQGETKNVGRKIFTCENFQKLDKADNKVGQVPEQEKDKENL